MATATPKVDHILDAADEPLRFSRPRWIPDAEMDITPMIDITFLLLIFFLVATRMSTEAAVELPSARHGTAVTANDSAILTMLSGDGDQADIFKADGAIAGTQLVATSPAGQEREIADYLQQMIDQQGKRYVLIKAEKDLMHREVARVAGAVRQATDAQLFVAVLEQR